MRSVSWLFLLMAAMLPGCQTAATAVAVADVASVSVFGRGMVDLGVSAVSGKDCSVVRLDKGLQYCAPREGLPPAPPFCTATLGTVQCWANPEAFGVLPHQLADAPALSTEQVRNVAARWPKSLNVTD